MAITVLITSCSPSERPRCEPSPDYSKSELQSFLRHYSETREPAMLNIGGVVITPEAASTVMIDDIELLPLHIEVEDGWFAYAFRIEKLGEIEFSVLTGPNCKSEVSSSPAGS